MRQCLISSTKSFTINYLTILFDLTKGVTLRWIALQPYFDILLGSEGATCDIGIDSIASLVNVAISQWMTDLTARCDPKPGANGMPKYDRSIVDMECSLAAPTLFLQLIKGGLNKKYICYL